MIGRAAGHLRRQWIGVVALLLVVGGGSQVLAHGGDTGAIHACVYPTADPKAPNVHINDNAVDACPRDSGGKEVDWAIQGPGSGDSADAEVEPPANFDRPTRALERKARDALRRKDRPGNDAFSIFRDAPLQIATGADALNPLTRLQVPGGSYVVVAKGSLNFGAPAESPGAPVTNAAECRLQAGDDFDRFGRSAFKQFFLAPGNAGFAMTVVHRFANPGQIELRCIANKGRASITQLKITAVQVNRISNKPAP